METVDIRRYGAALLFLTAGMYTLDAYGTLNSSPWTAENIGADAEKVASLKEYVTHAVVMSGIYVSLSAALAGNVLPLVGWGLQNAYLIWLYNRAAARGEAAGTASLERFNDLGGSENAAGTQP